MVLSTEWSQVEVIDLVNDGSGLGFGIVGGRSTGVVIKSILPGGIADRDGRLQSGDHILQIGDVQTRGLASEHVATILRQCAVQVRIVVARPVEPTSCDYRALGSDAPIVPTKTLTDPDELETLLMQQNGVGGGCYPGGGGGGAFETPSSASDYDKSVTYPIITTINLEHNETDEFNCDDGDDQRQGDSSSPESETIQVHLEKNSYGLGITVAGYVWEREDLSGIFVKGISEGSAAHLSGQIHLNDRIVEVDTQSLRGVTNHEAVEMLRRTGTTVDLVLERYLRGPRYEHLLNALQADHHQHQHPVNQSPPSPSVTTLSWFPVQTDCDTDDCVIEPEPESHTTIDSTIFEPPDPDTVEVFVDPHFESGSVTPELDMVVKKRWNSLIGDDTEIVVAQLRKLRGLGISLEGTVDVEDGVELRPRHFIRSILPEGPVGRNGKLSTGDELLEVNGQKLLGRNHVDVVKILKELPETVRIVCARGGASDSRVINTKQDREGFAARNLLSGSLRTLLNVDDDVGLKTPGALEDDETLNNTSSTATLADVDVVNDDDIITNEDGGPSQPGDGPSAKTTNMKDKLKLNLENGYQPRSQSEQAHEDGDPGGKITNVDDDNVKFILKENGDRDRSEKVQENGDPAKSTIIEDVVLKENGYQLEDHRLSEKVQENDDPGGKVTNNKVEVLIENGYQAGDRDRSVNNNKLELKLKNGYQPPENSDVNGAPAVKDALERENNKLEHAYQPGDRDQIENIHENDDSGCKMTNIENVVSKDQLGDRDLSENMQEDCGPGGKTTNIDDLSHRQSENVQENGDKITNIKLHKDKLELKLKNGYQPPESSVEDGAPDVKNSLEHENIKLENGYQPGDQETLINHEDNVHDMVINNNNNKEHDQCTPPKLTKMEQGSKKMSSKMSTSSKEMVLGDEAVTYLAIWKQEVEYIELYKGSKGLGFSILDYQDPLDPNGTVIVVRSLVPRGCAELDGHLHPGDRIMSVNNQSLKNVSLDDAVKALKGTAPGVVRIGFSKPMPLTSKQHHKHRRQHHQDNDIHGDNDDDDDDDDFNIQDNYFIW